MNKRIAKTLSLNDLFKLFSTERKAVRWLERSRWGDKPICAHCGGNEKLTVAKTKKHTYWCCGCHKHFTVKTGSVMHGSNLDVQKWAIAIYAVLTARKGVSSLQMSKELGITQKSSWFMLQRIREACRQKQFKLEGIVEVDETYIGGKEGNKHESKKLHAGRGGVGKNAVLGMRQRGGKVKAKPVENVEGESIVVTDDHRAYLGLIGVYHHPVNHSAGEYVKGMAHTNSIESVWSVFKGGINGTYHHVNNKHLQRYVDEFAFRLNEGNCEVDTIDRMESLVKGMGGKRITYKELIK